MNRAITCPGCRLALLMPAEAHRCPAREPVPRPQELCAVRDMLRRMALENGGRPALAVVPK